MSNPTAPERLNETRGQVELGNVEFVGVNGFGGGGGAGELVVVLVEFAGKSFEGFFAEEGGVGGGDGGGDERWCRLEARASGVAVGSEEVVEVRLGV